MTRKKMLSVIMCLSIGLFAVNVFAAPSESVVQDLYENAKAEGEVIWQVLGATAMWKPMADAFEAKYPGIKVSLFSARGSQMPARIITELRANKLTVDVATCSGVDEIVPLIERDLLLSYDWSKISDVNPEDVYFDGRFIPYYDSPMIWVYNPQLVSKEDMPKSWDDILDPRWKGSKISVRSNANNLGGLFPAWRKDSEKVMRYLENLKNQEVMPASGGNVAASRVASGECPIGLIRGALLPTFERKGTPFGLLPISPAVNTPAGFYTPKEKAPHSNAAKLFIGWANTSEARVVFRDNGRGLASPCGASPVAQALCDNGIQHVRVGRTLDEIKDFRRFVKEATDAMGWGTRKK